MANITINSHDVLGKCSVIKNYIAVLLADASLSQQAKDYLDKAYSSNEEIIEMVKKLVEKVKSN
jgi:hypothetical protein